MLVTNSVKYAKNYRLHRVGAATLILCKDIMIIKIQLAFVIYKNGYLLGTIYWMRNVYTSTDLALYKTKWDSFTMCGCAQNIKHNIPFYKYTDTISVFGFMVEQHPFEKYGNAICANLYELLTQI